MRRRYRIYRWREGGMVPAAVRDLLIGAFDRNTDRCLVCGSPRRRWQVVLNKREGFEYVVIGCSSKGCVNHELCRGLVILEQWPRRRVKGWGRTPAHTGGAR